ncbi:MAG: hypothetical protein SNJ71_01295 [Bacteroidales bacterium]
MAGAVYLYIPSRAVHHNIKNPFRISFAELLKQVTKCNITAKSQRLRKFIYPERNKHVFKELDGQPTLRGILRATYEDNADDYNAIFWIENTEIENEHPNSNTKNNNSFLADLFSKYNVPQSFIDSIQQPQKINPYAEEKLNSLNVDINSNQSFYIIAQNILGEAYFNSVVGQCAVDTNNPVTNIKSTSAVLGYRLKTAIQSQLENLFAKKNTF